MAHQWYGARYYDPKISVWLSVDPLAHEYPSLSSYVFSGNSPLNIIDPDGMQLTKFENAETGETVEVDDGMDQTVTVSQADWATSKQYAKTEKGNSPSQAYNQFIEANEGTAVPTETDGGIIKDKELFQGFMEFKAATEKVEVSAFSVSDKSASDSFVINPWIGNSSEKSVNDKREVLKYGYVVDNINGMYHTHPGKYSSGAPSWDDSRSSSINRIPNYSVGSDGKWWKAYDNMPYWQWNTPKKNTNPPMIGFGSKLKTRP